MKKITEAEQKILNKDVHEGFDAKLPYIRPVDAATLVIIDSNRKKPRVLMGKRSAKHKFMPNKFVFPGGRVDPCDTRLKTQDTLRAPVMRRLRQKTSTRMTDNRLRGMALAAVRETFEETGLIIGSSGTGALSSSNPEWAAFLAQGAVPSIRNLDFVGRAITPTLRPRRFDTRFFCVEASELFNDPKKLGGTGELLELHWLTFDEAKKKDLPSITHYVLLELEKRLQVPTPERFKKPAFFFRTANSKPDIAILR
ncbi:MAG: NUDIX hydrolase [Parvibaculales bacterium]